MRRAKTYLEFTELANDGFVQQKLDVFEEVVSLGQRAALAYFLSMSGLMWVDSLQYTQSSVEMENISEQAMHFMFDTFSVFTICQ